MIEGGEECGEQIGGENAGSEDGEHALFAQENRERAPADGSVMLFIAVVVDGEHGGGDEAYGGGGEHRFNGDGMGLQIVGAADGDEAEEEKNGDFTKRRVGDGLGAAHVAVGGDNGGGEDDEHDPAAAVNEIRGVQKGDDAQQLDGALHGGDGEPAVGGGARQSLALSIFSLALGVARVVFHVAHDLHENGQQQRGGGDRPVERACDRQRERKPCKHGGERNDPGFRPGAGGPGGEAVFLDVGSHF